MLKLLLALGIILIAMRLTGQIKLLAKRILNAHGMAVQTYAMGNITHHAQENMAGHVAGIIHTALECMPRATLATGLMERDAMSFMFATERLALVLNSLIAVLVRRNSIALGNKSLLFMPMVARKF